MKPREIKKNPEIINNSHINLDVISDITGSWCYMYVTMKIYDFFSCNNKPRLKQDFCPLFFFFNVEPFCILLFFFIFGIFLINLILFFFDTL